ncbi:MAG: Exocyst complex component 5 [Lichina confinis]|nr:MAG: Exocyst complex component 5 [Lichina confinis]
MPDLNRTSLPLSRPGSTQALGARAIFPKGPDFTLENFSSKGFLVQDLIESLSESTLQANRRSAPAAQSAFDPKPFIRTFEHALSRLALLSEDLASRETELQAGVRRAESQNAQTLESLGRQLDQTIDSFQSLDTSLSSANGVPNEEGSLESGGNVAVRIGEELEELDRQSRRAQDAKFLIQCWTQVSKTGRLTSLEEIRQHGGAEGKVRCAVLARQLARISQRLDPGNWDKPNGEGRSADGAHSPDGQDAKHNTREAIEKFAETLEKDLLQQFDESYRKQDFEGMRSCANVLYDFNGGANVVALFVNQHQFFIDRSQLVTEEVDGDQDIWNRVADPDAAPPPVEASLQGLVDEVKLVAQDESYILKRAFPYHETVLIKFLQRVFQQSVQQRLEMVLEKAKSVSVLAFLRSLQAARACIGALVDDLKAHGMTEHPEAVSLQVSMTLDQQVDELFTPYLSGSSYIDCETRSLEELYSSLLFKYTIFHSRRKKNPSTFMASLAKSGSELLASARDAYIDRLGSSDLTAPQKAMLLRIARLKEAETAKNKGDIAVSEQDGLLSVETSKRMLRWLAESVGRGLELSNGNENSKDLLALLNFLLTHMGEIYIETSLDSASDAATSQESTKNEPDLSYLPHLRPAITTMHLMVACINTVLLPLAGSSLSIRRQMERRANTAIARMEGKVNSVMQHTVDVVLAWTGKLLQTQKKADFRPKDGAGEGGGNWLNMLQTPTCLSVTNFLAKVKDALAQSIDGKNLELFTTEMAIGVRTQLLDHFKKFQVNATGGLMVTKDMTRYADTLRSLPVALSFLPSLDVLSEIGSLFVIGPEALRDRLRGGTLSLLGIEKTELRPYILRREDVGSVGVQSILNGM